MKGFAIGCALCLVTVLAGCRDRATAPAGDSGGEIVSVDAGANPEPLPPGEGSGQKAVGETKDGLREGPWTFFHDNGKKAAAGEYRAGMKEGPWVFWHPNGEKAAEGGYRGGLKEGAWIDYDEQGQKLMEKQYRGGMEAY